MSGKTNDVGFLDNLPVPCHEIDRHGTVRRVNRAECQLLGYEEASVVGRPVWELVAPDIRHVSRLAVERKLSGLEPLRPYEREYVTSDGRPLIMETHESLLHDHSGQICGIRTVMLDRTARRRAEEQLRASEERWQLALHGANDGLWDWKLTTNEIFRSKRCKEMFGYAEDEVENSSDGWRRLVHPEDRARFEQELQNHLNRKTGFYSAEYRMRATRARS